MDVPTPSVEASEEVDTEVEVEKIDTTARIAHLKRLVKLAKAVKKSKKLSAEEKTEALETIKSSAKLEKKAAEELKIKRNDLNKMLTTDVTKIMKTTNKLNELTKSEKGVTLREALKEMQAWGKAHDIKVDFPQNILSKQIGSCSAEWLIKLGPMIATMLQKFEKMKADALEKEEKDNK